jgi:hypothetical protein
MTDIFQQTLEIIAKRYPPRASCIRHLPKPTLIFERTGNTEIHLSRNRYDKISLDIYIYEDHAIAGTRIAKIDLNDPDSLDRIFQTIDGWLGNCWVTNDV